MTELKSPRVFLCHASEDKERFVVPLATALRAKGIDAWLDQWEIPPGESLPHKVFTEGMGTSDVVIPIITTTSKDKPWVNAELDAAIVRRINAKTRLIPVILDLKDEDVPVALQATKWVRINDPSNFEKELDELVNAILERPTKPLLGPLPGFAQLSVPASHLAQQDEVALRVLCDVGLQEDSFLVSYESTNEQANKLGISPQAFSDALEILAQEGYVKLERVIGGIAAVTLWSNGVERYCRAYVPGYDQLLGRAISALANSPAGKHHSNQSLSEELNASDWVVSHILTLLAERGLIKIQPVYMGERFYSVWKINPQLRRALG